MNRQGLCFLPSYLLESNYHSDHNWENNNKNIWHEFFFAFVQFAYSSLYIFLIYSRTFISVYFWFWEGLFSLYCSLAVYSCASYNSKIDTDELLILLQLLSLQQFQFNILIPLRLIYHWLVSKIFLLFFLSFKKNNYSLLPLWSKAIILLAERGCTSFYHIWSSKW